MKTLLVLFSSFALAAMSAMSAMIETASAAPRISKEIAAAVADTTRPEADRGRDNARKPADTLAFAGAKPGLTVPDFIPTRRHLHRLLAQHLRPRRPRL